MRDVIAGQTDYTVFVKVNLTTGAPATGLAHTDIDIAYSRVETDNDVTVSDVAPASLSALTDAHSDWGFKEIHSTDAPGLYRLDIADAVFAAGAWEAVVTITDASGTDFYAVDIGFRLVDAPLTNATIADAIWDELLAGHAIADSAGKALGDAGVTLAIIQSQTSLITAGGVQAVIGGYSNGHIALKQGDAYNSTTGQVLSIPKPTGAVWPADLTLWTVTLKANAVSSMLASISGTRFFTNVLSVVAPAGAQTLQVTNLSATTTAALAPGSPNMWVFEIEAVLTADATQKNTLMKGTMSIIPNITGTA